MSEAKEEKQEKSLSELEIYQTYLQRVRESEELQMQIIRGVREGEDCYRLLILAARAISRMTGSNVLLDEVEKMVRSVYGEALGEKVPLEIEIEETRKRLERIRKAAASAETLDLKETMELAIRSHEARLKKLEAVLAENSADQ